MYCETIYFLVIDPNLASDNPSRVKKNLRERIKKLIMTIDDRLEMKNYNMILTETQRKSQHYRLEKLINMNILQVKKYYLLIKEE